VVAFDVEDVGRGKIGRRVDVHTGNGGGDCGYAFRVGERYVVYARRRPDGTLSTGICSRTRPASEAAEDLAYFASLPASGAGARVFGEIKHWEHDAAARQSVQHGSLADVQVLARGPRGTFSAMTDPAGKYTISGLPVGSYEIEVVPPPLFSPRYLRRTIEFSDTRACYVADFALHYNGRISGVLQQNDGRPVAGQRLEVLAADRPGEPGSIYPPNAVTDSAGRFELEDIPPGRYLIGVGLRPDLRSSIAYPPTLLPSAARNSPDPPAIEVGKGEQVDLGVLRIPDPLAPRTLSGVVVMPDGSPAVGADVVAWDARHRQAAMGVSTDNQGRFTIQLFAGQRYTLRAFLNVDANRQINGEHIVAPGAANDSIRLVLRPR
jgi:hypothetical protein